MKPSLTGLFLLPFLVGCDGSSNSPLFQPQKSAYVPEFPQARLSTVTEARSDAEQPSRPMYTPNTNDLLYVGNQGNNSITVYRHDASGNTAPLRVISGSKTGITFPGQLSEDAGGNLYVANNQIDARAGKNTNPSVLVFANGANGNVAPLRKLFGPLTGLHWVQAMTVDQTTGKLFVIDGELPVGDARPASLLRFPPNATGNVAPFARSVENLGPAPSEIANDSSGRNIIEAYAPSSEFALYDFGIVSLAKQFANNALPSAPYGVGVIDGLGVADDPTTKTYLVTGEPVETTTFGIYRFAENTRGSFPFDFTPPPKNPPTIDPPVVSIITSARGCGQLALGYLRNIYAVCGNAVKVFTHDSSGNVSPLRILTGSATRLNLPAGIYEGQ